MLQRTRNEQTLKILERLRKQGAPSKPIPLDMTQDDGGIEPNDEDNPQPDPAYEEGQGEDPSGETAPGTTIEDNTIPGNLALNGMRKAKKDLKRRA
jgi:hypothetical protein